MVDPTKPDSHNFFILVFGPIQQALDIIVSCVEYSCIPYVRNPVSLHYISLLSESMIDVEHVIKLRFKMSIAFVVYHLCNKNELIGVELNQFLKKKQEYCFEEKLFRTLHEKGINETNFLENTITQLVLKELQNWYDYLAGNLINYEQ